MRPAPGVPAIAAAAVLAAVASPRLAAADPLELLVSLGSGVYVPTRDNGFAAYDPGVYGSPGLAVDRLRPGVDLEVAVSAWWGHLGAQLGVGYLTASWEQTSVGTVPISALLRARLPLGPVAPYLEGGGGISFTSATAPALPYLAPPAVPPAVSSSATTLEWIAGVGAELDLGSIRFGASVRYLWFDPHPLSSSSGAPLRYATGMRFLLDGVTAGVSVGYRFPLTSR